MSRPLRWGSLCAARLSAALLSVSALVACGGAQTPVAREGSDPAPTAATSARPPEGEPRTSLSEFRSKLAGFKKPRRFLFVDSLERNAAGKANYQMLRKLAAEKLGQ